MLFLNLNSEERQKKEGKKKKEKRRRKRKKKKKQKKKEEEGDGLHFKGAPKVRQPTTARSAENFCVFFSVQVPRAKTLRPTLLQTIIVELVQSCIKNQQ